MSAPSPFVRNLLLNLRTSAIVVAVVAIGLLIYAWAIDEAVEWQLLLYVAIGMSVSTILYAVLDARKKKV